MFAILTFASSMVYSSRVPEDSYFARYCPCPEKRRFRYRAEEAKRGNMHRAFLILASSLIRGAAVRAQTVPKRDQLGHARVDSCANEPLLEKRLENMEVQLKDW